MPERMNGGDTTKSEDQDNRGATTKTLEETLRPRRVRHYRGSRPVGRQDETVLRVRCPTFRTVAAVEQLKRKHPGMTYAGVLDLMAAAAIEQYPELSSLRGFPS